MSSLVRLSFSLEGSLFRWLESLVEAAGYENRSEFIRDMIRDRLVEEFGKFLQTLDTSTYNPRAWTLENATLEIANERWRKAMGAFQSMSGWDLGVSPA